MKVLIMTALYPTPENPAYGSFVRTQIESLRRVGVEIELLVLGGRPRKLKYPRSLLQLRQRLADPSIDLVHAHFGYVGMVARTQWQVPVVVTYHGDDLLGTVNPRGRLTRWSRLSAAGGRLLGRLADAVIVQSVEMANQLKRPDVHIIPHEVDLKLFQPVERGHAREILGLHPAKKYLLFAANPRTPVKRFPLAQAAAEALSRQDPEVELRVVYREPQDRLALYMNACDALVFPSYQEGSPNIVKQAMACNLPIVATDVGDVRKVIGGTPGCYICKPEVAEFANRLSEVLHTRQRTQGRERVRHLDCPLVAQRLIKIYGEVLKRCASRPPARARNAS